MNRETLSRLQEAGLSADTEAQLDFTYVAADRQHALVLKDFLEQNDCLDVSVDKLGRLLSRRYEVTGTGQPTTLSLEILDEWVERMVVQGLERGCEFDGWRAFVPGPEAGELRNIAHGDHSRLFLLLPENGGWDQLRDHIATLPGVTIDRYHTDHVVAMLLDFTFRGFQFTVSNDMMAEYDFIVHDADCPDEVLRAVADHCVAFTGRKYIEPEPS